MPDPKDPRSDDLEEAYDAEYLREAAGGSAREERLAELKRRIELGAYHPDPTSIAEGLLSRARERHETAEDESGE